jgi:transposase-like protein
MGAEAELDRFRQIELVLLVCEPGADPRGQQRLATIAAGLICVRAGRLFRWWRAAPARRGDPRSVTAGGLARARRVRARTVPFAGSGRTRSRRDTSSLSRK